MKKLKNFVKKETLNVEELMMIKGADGDRAASGCGSIACPTVSCSSLACGSGACDSKACNSKSCSGATCTSQACTTLSDASRFNME